MAKQSFLLVSLKEDKAKELAQVLSNDSCRKILDYLAEKEHVTETEIAKELNLPISTVHYNLQNLLKAGIIAADEYHYSPKGKEVNHYKLANKYIIIAPRSTYGIKEKLKSILPLSLVALISAGAIHLFTRTNNAFSGTGALMQTAVQNVPAPMMEKAVVAADSAVEETARAATYAVPEMVGQAAAQPNYALWFLYGALFVIGVIVVIELINAWREKRRNG